MRTASALLAAAGTVITGSGLLFSALEHVSTLSGIYWAFTTATTVGYGDVTAKDTAGQLLTIAVMLTAIPLLAAAFSAFHLDRISTALRDHHRAITRELQETAGQAADDSLEQGSEKES